MDSVAVRILRDIHPDAAYPFSEEHPFYALVEIASTAQDAESDNEDGDLERMYNFIESIEDCIIVSPNCTAEKNKRTVVSKVQGASTSASII